MSDPELHEAINALQDQVFKVEMDSQKHREVSDAILKMQVEAKALSRADTTEATFLMTAFRGVGEGAAKAGFAFQHNRNWEGSAELCRMFGAAAHLLTYIPFRAGGHSVQN